MYVGTIPCPTSSATNAGSLGLQNKFLENPETTIEDFEPCSSAPFPETTRRTGDVFIDDLFTDLKEDSVPLVSQTGEKRKRVKMVARRT